MFNVLYRVFMKNVGPLKSKTGKSAMELVSRIVTSGKATI